MGQKGSSGKCLELMTERLALYANAEKRSAMYTLHKIINDQRIFLGWYDSPTDGAQAIEADMQAFDDSAIYELKKEGKNADRD